MFSFRGCLRRNLSALPTHQHHTISSQIASNSIHFGPFPGRTHTCGSLSSEDIGKRVVLTGWISTERKVSKSLSFFALKDSYGSTQLLIRKRPDSDALSHVSDISPDSVVVVEGTVKGRLKDAVRLDQGPTGEIEVHLDGMKVLNPAEQLPFSPSDEQNLANPELRARYRYLDLRRDSLANNLRKRSDVSRVVREVLEQHDFVEVETPMLLRSSPEGAREYLVPSRSSAADGSPQFYALSQSPQQPKQLLMASGGVDKYFQFARCFRDEGGRADRQPEFTQIDMEMAFVSQGGPVAHEDAWKIGGREVRNVVEDIVKRVWSRTLGIDLPSTFHVMTYHEAMSKYGSDKPDTSFGLEIMQVPLSQGRTLDCLLVQDAELAQITEADLDPSDAEEGQLKRIVVSVTDDWLEKCHSFSTGEQLPASSAKPGDVIWMNTRDRPLEGGSTALGRLRLRLRDLGIKRGLLKENTAPHFLWVTEFPLFTKADDDKNFLANGRWSSSHHPFTAPMWEDMPALLEGRYDGVRGQHYDLVLNGVEVAGGSVRVHDSKLQEKIFDEVLQLTGDEKAPFVQLIHALKCGAPPHGGIAIGFDRLMTIICGEKSIRQVIAFPKTQGGTDPLFKSPAPVSDAVLLEYSIAATKKP